MSDKAVPMSALCCGRLYLSDANRWILLSLFLFILGLCVTAGLVAFGTLDLNARRISVHESDTASCMRVLNSVVHSVLTAVLSARNSVVAEHSGTSAGSSCSGGRASLAPPDAMHMLDEILQHAGRVFTEVDVALGAFTVVSEANRTVLEQRYNDRCRAFWGGANLSLAPVAEARTLAQRGITRANLTGIPPSSTGLYLALTRVWRADGSPAASCPVELYDATDNALRMEAITTAMASGRIAWLRPTASTLSANIKSTGMVVPVLADDAASSGSVGALHTRFFNTTVDNSTRASLASVCQPQGRTVCGQQNRAIGAIVIPLLVETALPAMEDVLGSVVGTRVTVVEVTPWAGMIQSAVAGAANTLLLQFLADPSSLAMFPDATYVDQRTSVFNSLLRKGSVADILRRVSVSDVISTSQLASAGNWRVGIDPEQALHDAIRFDSMTEGLQATQVFLRGTRLYLLIVRHGAETTINLDGARTTVIANAFVGLFASLLLAAIPLGIRYMKQYEAKRIQHALELVNAERDGVVQAVAFAAHEIRNPMHGVLASLETAVADAAPLKRILRVALNAGADSQDAFLPDIDQTSMASPSVASGLQRLLGEDTCKAALDALTDIGVAKNSAENCHRLVNDMIDYSKLQRGAMALKLGAMNVQPSLRRLIAANKGFIPVRVSTVLGVDPALPASVVTDEVRVLQVLTNGLTNAGKFCVEGSITMTACLLDTSALPFLRLPHNPGDKWLVITTCDTGKGLGGINVDKLFEPTSAQASSSKTEPAASRGGLFSSLRALAAGGGRTHKGKVEPAVPEEYQAGSQISQLVRRLTDNQAGSNGSLEGRRSLSAPALSRIPSGQRRSSKLLAPMSAADIAKSRGSGLGLPVARLMARALGGDIDLYSNKQPRSDRRWSTCFLFILPMAAVTRGVDGSLPVIEQCPLFGRAGVLDAAARAALRAAIEARVQELDKQHDDLLYMCITSTRQAAAGSFTYSKQEVPSRRNSAASRAEGAVGRKRAPTGGLPSPSLHSTFATDPVPMVATLAASGTGSSVHFAASLERMGGVEQARRLSLGRGQAMDSATGLTVQVPSPSGRPTLSAATREGTHPDVASTTSSLHTAERDFEGEPISPVLTTALLHAAGPPLTLLYAEDDTTNRRLMERMLGRLGKQPPGTSSGAGGSPVRAQPAPVQLVMAENGWVAICQLYSHGLMSEEGLKRARALAAKAMGRADADVLALLPDPAQPAASGAGSVIPSFDLICCDNDMPLLNGMQVAALVQQGGMRSPLVPVVAVTGRCSGFFVLQSYLARCGLTSEEDAAALSAQAPTMQVVPELPDKELQASSFVAVLGKPYKTEDLAGLLALTRMARERR